MSNLEEVVLAVKERKAKFEEEKGQLTSKIGEAVLLFERTIQPSGSSTVRQGNSHDTKTTSANITRLGKGT